MLFTNSGVAFKRFNSIVIAHHQPQPKKTTSDNLFDHVYVVSCLNKICSARPLPIILQILLINELSSNKNFVLNTAKLVKPDGWGLTFPSEMINFGLVERGGKRLGQSFAVLRSSPDLICRSCRWLHRWYISTKKVRMVTRIISCPRN